MKICVIGAGYVGLTTAAVLSKIGHQVCCVDTNIEKIAELRKDQIPIHEPGLTEIVSENRKLGNLQFQVDPIQALKQNEVVIVAVGTPPGKDGYPDLTAVNKVIEQIAESIESYQLILTKSTVPPGTNELIERSLLEKGVDHSLFDVVSNPEFLREGTAIDDTLHPHKIVVGTNKPDLVDTVRSVYEGIEAPYIVTSYESAELIKYASNTFLATKISFANEMARICEACGAHIQEVTKGIGMDPRIGPHFLGAGLGYGGSCLPKDLLALEQVALKNGVIPTMLHAAKSINDSQIEVYVNKLQQELGDLDGKQITIWGLSFKANTDDVRFSPSLNLTAELNEKNCRVHTYDPLAKPVESHAKRFDDLYEALAGSDAVIVATDWQLFQEADWHIVKEKLKGDLVLDARNCLNKEQVRSVGLKYAGVATG